METINRTTENDMNLCRQYAGDWFNYSEKLPVSYVYNSKKYKGLPKNSTVSKRFIDANIVETTMIGTIDNTLQIKAECLTYRDYPAVEWTVYFSCAPGSEKTDIFENVLGADIFFGSEKAPVLVHNNGDFYSKDGYTVGHTVIGEDIVFTQAPVGGRPCDRAFPYQRLLFDGFYHKKQTLYLHISKL